MTMTAFFLALFAFTGCVMIYVDPLRRLNEQIRGKTRGQISAEAKEWIETSGPGTVVAKGCSLLFFIVLALIFDFVVEPIAILYAITQDVGNQPLAYAMLGIVAIAWVIYARAFFGNKKAKVDVADNEVIPLPSPAIAMARRIFFALPTLYLWYIFAVVMGWIQ